MAVRSSSVSRLRRGIQHLSQHRAKHDRGFDVQQTSNLRMIGRPEAPGGKAFAVTCHLILVERVALHRHCLRDPMTTAEAVRYRGSVNGLRNRRASGLKSVTICVGREPKNASRPGWNSSASCKSNVNAKRERERQRQGADEGTLPRTGKGNDSSRCYSNDVRYAALESTQKKHFVGCPRSIRRNSPSATEPAPSQQGPEGPNPSNGASRANLYFQGRTPIDGARLALGAKRVWSRRPGGSQRTAGR
jgi:hypothetical protein